MQAKDSKNTWGIVEKLKNFQRKKNQVNCQKYQGFDLHNSSWFLLPKNVQKISLYNSNLQCPWLQSARHDWLLRTGQIQGHATQRCGSKIFHESDDQDWSGCPGRLPRRKVVHQVQGVARRIHPIQIGPQSLSTKRKGSQRGIRYVFFNI